MTYKKPYLLSESASFSPWQSAMLDLIDIFAPSSEAPPSAELWDPSGATGHAQAAGPLRVDPWDSLGRVLHVLITRHSLLLMEQAIKRN